MVKEEDILQILSTIHDPEIPLDIVNLGLIEKVFINENKVSIQMTLTTPNCPLKDLIQSLITSKINEKFPNLTVNINFIFDKPWNTDRISKEGKEKLKALGWNL